MIIKTKIPHKWISLYNSVRVTETDAEQLSEIRVQIDGETENMDREAGEDLDKIGFQNS